MCRVARLVSFLLALASPLLAQEELIIDQLVTREQWAEPDLTTESVATANQSAAQGRVMT